MKKIFITIFVLLLSFSVLAQQRTGNIYGKVVDTEGNPLPGVTVTLTGRVTAPVPTVSSAEGVFRFLSLSPASDYSLKAELQGFKPRTESGIIVTVGSNVSITLTLEMGVLTEEVTVTAVTPVVDTKKTSVSQVVSQEVLQSLPSARDPWVVLQMAPSVQTSVENVGGSESGNQTMFVGKGATDYYSNVWSVDGSVITDVSSTASPIYYDFDSFEEMNITVGGNDVSVQTGGIAVNMVTRRGGNQMSLGGRFYVTDEKFQADNLTDALKKEGVAGTNRIVDIKDYGFNWGGPIIRDRAWVWMSYGVQDIKTFVLTGAKNDAMLTNWNGKINLQFIPQNRLEIYGTVGKKEMWGRGATYSDPLGNHQRPQWHFGAPVFKIQDEHMFGDTLFVSAKYTWVDSGFQSAPVNNEDLARIGKWDVAKGQYIDKYSKSGDHRYRNNVGVTANYFKDNLFGMGHEIKAGLDYSYNTYNGTAESRSSLEINWNTPQIDFNGDKTPDVNMDIVKLKNRRYTQSASGVKQLAAFLSDTITVGKFNILLGLRYDKQSPWIRNYPVFTSVHKETNTWTDNITPATADVINSIFPGMQIPEIKPDYYWEVISPRLGITWDVQGNGKTIAKLFFGQYGDFMWTDEPFRFNPLGTGGTLDFWWLDKAPYGNGDKIMNFTELYWHNRKTYAPYRVFDDAGKFIGNYDDMKNILWSGYDPAKPTQTTDPSQVIDESSRSSRTQEAIMTLEREIAADLGVTLSLSYRKYDHLSWDLRYFPATGQKESQSDYVQVGTVPSQVGSSSVGSGAGKPYYLMNKDFGATTFTYRTRRPDYNQKYYGLDLMLNKRLSHRWMMSASLTLQNQSVDYGSQGYLNPTQIWALDGQIYSALLGGSMGKVSQYVFSRYLFKVSALYQFPYDINCGLTMTAREGSIIPEYFTVIDYNAPNSRYQTVDVYMEKFGTKRLPNFIEANLRIERLFKAGTYGKIYLMVDIFNLFNSSVINRRYDRKLGTYYPSTGLFVSNPTNYLANEILNPRVVRFGVRFQF